MTQLIRWRWLGRWAPARRRRDLGQRSRRRPALEVLESRCVPSTVTNLDDAGAGSLRQAILDTPSGGTVDFQPGLTGTIPLTTGELVIDKDLTIAGPGADVLTVSGNAASRVFDVPGSFSVTLTGLTIAGGQATGNQYGGGISNTGSLTISNATLSGDRAVFGGGIFNSGLLNITDSTLSGNFAQNGAGIGNLFGTVNLSRCSFTGNTSFGGGGMINLGGTLTVTDSVFSSNSAFNENPGGGIYNDYGRATVINSTFSRNLSAYGAGLHNQSGTLTVIGSTISGSTGSGIFNNFGGTATVIGCTLSGNNAVQGGGIYNRANGTVTVTDSTLSGNRATDTTLGFGGGIFNDGTFGAPTVTVANSTLSGNVAAAAGGGLYQVSSGSLTVRNTLVAGNTARSSPDVSGSLNSQGYDLIGDGTGGSGWTDTDLVGTHDAPINPLLGPLQDHGGPTQTMALLPGSPALNAGDSNELGVADQRGVIRSGGVNVGAYQASASAFVLTAPAKVTAGVPFDLTVTAVDPFGQVAVGNTGTVTFSTTDPDPGVVLPADYTFTAADAGVHSFGDATLATRGQQAIAVMDMANHAISGNAAVKVRHMRHRDGGSARVASDREVAVADRVFATLADQGFWFRLPSPHFDDGRVDPREQDLLG
jgi:hypothetical protein